LVGVAGPHRRYNVATPTCSQFTTDFCKLLELLLQLFKEFLFQQTLDQNFPVGIWIVYMQGMQKWEREDWQKNLLYPITISSKDFVPHRLVVQDVFLRDDL
jgi:hypothetical protein